MRKWVFIAGGILLILSIATVVGVLNINSYIRRNRDYLIQQAEKAVGRQVEVANIEISIWNGIGIRFENFKLADDPAFSSESFVRAKDLQANVKLLPLLRGDVQVKKLILNEPAINIIRNRQGVYNFSTIGPAEQKKKSTSGSLSRQSSARTGCFPGFFGRNIQRSRTLPGFGDRHRFTRSAARSASPRSGFPTAVFD